jgi:hypothetical protein
MAACEGKEVTAFISDEGVRGSIGSNRGRRLKGRGDFSSASPPCSGTTGVAPDHVLGRTDSTNTG